MRKQTVAHRVKAIAGWLEQIADSNCKHVDQELAHRGLDLLESSISKFVGTEPMSPNKLADELGVSKETLRNYVIKHNLKGTEAVGEPTLRVYPSETVSELRKLLS